MKTIFSFLLVVALINSTSAQSEEAGPSMIIKTNFLPTFISQIPLVGEYRLVYEQAIPFSSHSLSIGLSYNSTPLLLSRLYDSTIVNGLRFQAQYKFYFSKNKYAPSGVYIGPHLSYNIANFENSDIFGEYAKFTYMNINILFGYQVIADETFALDIFSGLGYKNNSFSYNDPSITAPNQFRLGKGGKFTFGFNFGVAF